MEVDEILYNLERTCNQLSKAIDQSITSNKDKSQQSTVYSKEVEKQAKLLNDQKKKNRMAVEVIDKIIIRLTKMSKNSNG